MDGDDPDEDVGHGEGRGVAERAAFHLALRARGVRDLAVLRAMERVPRLHFLEPRHALLAARDLAAPIAGGQTASPAWLVAVLLEALAVEPGNRILQVGAGSGFATAVLAQLGAAVVALERVRCLATLAAARLDALGVAGIDVRWADGCVGPGADGPFDGILVHGRCDDVPAALLSALNEGGRLVCVRLDGTQTGIARVAADGARQFQPLRGCRLPPLRSGLLDL